MRQGERLGNGEVKRHIGHVDKVGRMRDKWEERLSGQRGRRKACIEGETDKGKIKNTEKLTLSYRQLLIKKTPLLSFKIKTIKSLFLENF
jgi:hypothetical protein